MLKNLVNRIKFNSIKRVIIITLILFVANFFFKNSNTKDITNVNVINILKSECDCKKETTIILKHTDNNENIVSLFETNQLKNTYSISDKDLEESTFTCSLFNTFKRGRNQKVIGYALYGKGHLFYYNFVNLVKTVQNLLPGWILRVYYDDTIDLSIKCKIECIKNEKTNELIDNVDFCNINNLPKKNSVNETWSGSFMHAMTWRWLPIGDSFVDLFSSRDLDSHIIQREVDAVNHWIKSKQIGHIMRGKKKLFNFYDLFFRIGRDKIFFLFTE